MPSSVLCTSRPVKGGSVPLRRSTSYCSGVSCSRHCSLVFSMLVVMALMLAIGKRLDRDSMVGLPHPQLVARARAGGENEICLSVAAHGQLHVGDGAVHGVVLGPGRVGVDPAHEILRL